MTSNGLIQNADHLKQASPLIHWPLRRTSMRLLLPSVIGGLALIVFAPVRIAHFRLIEPASWLLETQFGDPQKMAPCGGTSADPGKPTGAVTSAQGGENPPSSKLVFGALAGSRRLKARASNLPDWTVIGSFSCTTHHRSLDSKLRVPAIGYAWRCL